MRLFAKTSEQQSAAEESRTLTEAQRWRRVIRARWPIGSLAYNPAVRSILCDAAIFSQTEGRFGFMYFFADNSRLLVDDDREAAQ